EDGASQEMGRAMTNPKAYGPYVRNNSSSFIVPGRVLLLGAVTDLCCPISDRRL
ncbi:hypothetical protein A2U01_0069819, partial [Trifolium medium]|nr:hypothetical protein [Trifolium medium]